MRIDWRITSPGVLLAAISFARPWLEATMARHMVIELPLLFALGWLAAHAAGPRLARTLTPWNVSGVPAFLAALLVTAFWMLPVALDMAVLDIRVGLVKVVSMVVAGAVTGASWRNAGLIMQAFLTLNWAWMTLTVGLLYQDAPQQLCSVYLSDQQSAAGAGMVALSLAALIGWLWKTFYHLIEQEDGPPCEAQGRRIIGACNAAT
jgi:Protein of unknown function (DUF1404)